MYLESSNDFMLAARLRKKPKNPHYVISMDAGEPAPPLPPVGRLPLGPC